MPRARHLSVLFMPGLGLGCGQTSHSGEANDGDSGTGTLGGTAAIGTGSGSVGGFGSSPGIGGSATTTVAATGSGGVGTGVGGMPGAGGTAGVGGGTPLDCGVSVRSLEACFTWDLGTGGAAGAAGATHDPAGEVAECWAAEPGSNCSANFSGVVRSTGRDIGADACSSYLFGGLTTLPDAGRSWIEVTDGAATLRLVLGRPEGELDVTLGDELEVALERRSYGADSMSGSRLTLERDGRLLAMLNDKLPIVERIHMSPVWLETWLLAPCEEPESTSGCAHRGGPMLVGISDQGLGAFPGTSAKFGAYELHLDQNREAVGDACEFGSVTDVGVFLVR